MSRSKVLPSGLLMRASWKVWCGASNDVNECCRDRPLSYSKLTFTLFRMQTKTTKLLWCYSNHLVVVYAPVPSSPMLVTRSNAPYYHSLFTFLFFPYFFLFPSLPDHTESINATKLVACYLFVAVTPLARKMVTEKEKFQTFFLHHLPVTSFHYPVKPTSE